MAMQRGVYRAASEIHIKALISH